LDSDPSASIRIHPHPSAAILIHQRKYAGVTHPYAENLGGFKWVSLAGAKYIERAMACPAGSRDVSRVSCNPQLKIGNESRIGTWCACEHTFHSLPAALLAG